MGTASCIIRAITPLKLPQYTPHQLRHLVIMLGANVVVEDAVVYTTLSLGNMRVFFLHKRIDLFYYRKQQEKLYNYFTVYCTYVCPTRTSALTEVDVSSRSDASWNLRDRVALKLLPQNFSILLKSFQIFATTMSPHDVVLALAFNHDTDWLPVTLQNLAQYVTDTVSHRIIFIALYRLKL
jgi:hypothetical protein